MNTIHNTLTLDLIFNRASHLIEATHGTDEQGPFTTIEVYVGDRPVYERVDVDGHVTIGDLYEIGQDLTAGRSGRFGIEWVREGVVA